MSNETSQSDCNELKTLKYKSMILNGVPWVESKSSIDLTKLDKFLENEKISNSNESWNKLDKTAKLKKLYFFANNYKNNNNLSESEHEQLISFFRDCLDKKKLQRAKDVNYNKDSGDIIDIPALVFNKPTTHFTLKHIEKRVSTIRGLAPKKKQGGTVKNVKSIDSDYTF